MNGTNKGMLSRLLEWLLVRFFKLNGWKAVSYGQLPDKAVIIAAPHTSNWDFVYYIGLIAYRKDTSLRALDFISLLALLAYGITTGLFVFGVRINNGWYELSHLFLVSSLVGLGIAAKDRLEALPDMPPLRDLGLPLSAFIRRGLAVPAGTPEDVCARLVESLHAVLADPEFTAQANENGTRPFWTSGAAWTAQAQAEREELAALWQAAPWMPTTTG